MEYKCKMVDGQPVIQAVVEKRKNANGGVDVIIHAPSLRLISEFKEKIRKEQNGLGDLSKI